MRSFHFAPLQAVVMFALGIMVGGGFLGGFMPATHAVPDPVITNSVKATCSSGDAAADFVCRNTWLANTRHSNR